MKTLMIGNQFVGYSHVFERIEDFTTFFPVEISRSDLREWWHKAKHGDVLRLPNDLSKRRHLICIDPPDIIF